jgi:hypothetical protein
MDFLVADEEGDALGGLRSCELPVLSLASNQLEIGHPRVVRALYRRRVLDSLKANQPLRVTLQKVASTRR